MFELEINKVVDKKVLGEIVDRCYRKYGASGTSIVLDKIKDLGFHYSTKGAVTVSVSDIVIPEEKQGLLKEADSQVRDIDRQYRRGLISDTERYEKVINTWNDTVDKVTRALMDSLDHFNPIYMMANSGARGSINQIRQLAGMRGLMANPTGKIIELPIRGELP